MRVLITGSSGQIGTNLALALRAGGHDVLGVDKRANAWTQAFPTEVLDLNAPPPPDPGAEGPLPRLARRFQPAVVVHLAAWAKVHQLVKEPGKAFENVAMVYWALEAARATGSAIVLGSSREVYGDILRHVTDETHTDFVDAASPYSAGKIAAEAFFSSYARCYGMPTLVFRFSNVYGRVRQRPGADGAGDSAVCAEDLARGADHGVRTGEDA